MKLFNLIFVFPCGRIEGSITIICFSKTDMISSTSTVVPTTLVHCMMGFKRSFSLCAITVSLWETSTSDNSKGFSI